jgi:hypothetical protein
MKKWMTLFLVLVVMVAFNSCRKSKIVTLPPSSSGTIESQEKQNPEETENDEVDLEKATESDESLISPDQFSSFEIIKISTTLRADNGQTLFILVPAVNLELRNHVMQTKNLIKKLIVTDKRPENISILIFDDPEALEKVFENPKTDDLNVPAHYLARYDGNPAETTYQYTLVIFPIAPDSNPAIKAQNDTIDFNPYEW